MERLLVDHLSHWLDGWPAVTELDIIGADKRDHPGWDGKIHPAIGVSSPEAGVLSVPPHAVTAVAEQYAEDKDLAVLGPRIPAMVGFPERGWFAAVYRWTTRPEPLPDAGTWMAIARSMGVSTRTVTRLVGELTTILGASSRFQAGVRAARLGWLDPG
ncbi:hypothetical protein [Nonomuraea sp. NPDC050202]|uniref:hypothetical protein n=1 Tax=Nonomuraea sp. NPDC050202 TaxID=3155035 RepID=UPI0033E4BD12